MVFNQVEFERAFLNLAAVNGHKSPEFSLHVFETLPSTNQKLWQLLKTGIDSPAVVITTEQTAGKGQWGRVWQSSPGGLYLSVSLTTNLTVSDSLPLTIASAWGIATALRQKQIPVVLKWPNDLILNGRKLGGILTETHIHNQKITQVVIGVGINWSNAVPHSAINLQSFYQQQSSPEITSLEQLAAITLTGILSGNQTYLHEGLKELLPSYLELLINQGCSVTIDGLPGKVIGVSSNGQLRIRLHSPGATTEILCPPGTISLGYD